MNPPIGDPPAIQWVAVDKLMIDATYQRGIEIQGSKALIKAMTRDWDWRLCQPLMVSKRADGLFVLDGQHRTEAAKARGDIAHLPCCVAEYASVAEEARVFVAANKARRAVKGVDTFRAAVTAGDEKASLAARLIAEAGLRYGDTSGLTLGRLPIGTINNVVGIVNALGKFKQSHISAALSVMGEAFREQEIVSPATIFNALITIFVHADATLDADLLNETMASMSPAEWLAHPMVEGQAAGMGRLNGLVSAIRFEMNERRLGLAA